MQTLEERRREEFKKYERPEYYGTMRPWRVALICEWLAPLRQHHKKHCAMLDVGCGSAESRSLAEALHFDCWHGCEVVESCSAEDVDIIAGAHDLPYDDNQFELVICCDVLEHVFEEDVPAALAEMHRVAGSAILLGISQKPGRFHPTIKSTEWWMDHVAKAMRGRKTQSIYQDRILHYKRPYLWLDIAERMA